MTKKKPLADICMDIYKEMYKEAEPSVNFDELIKTDEVKHPEWFNNYYLSSEKQKKIMYKHLNKYKLTYREQRNIQWEVYFGCAPTTLKIAGKKK